MHIVYLNPCGYMGGAETSLLTLLQGVRDAQSDWRLTLVAGEDGPLLRKVEALGVKVTLAPFPRGLARLGDAGSGHVSLMRSLLQASAPTALYLRRISRLLREVRPDLIHTNGFKMHLLGIWARPRGTPVVWHLHDYLSSRPVMSKALAWHSRRCSGAIVNSHSVAADVRSRLGSATQVETLYNAIDLDRFSPEGPCLDLDKLSGLPPAAPTVLRVGMVATFARWKGHKVFLEAMSRLPADAPVRGYVIGGPIYQTSGSQFHIEELRTEADRLGLAGSVGFTGFVDDASAAMRSLDIVVHASTEPEPFGMVIAEAMACRKPVISSSAGGALEVFEEGETGLGHPAGDAGALARRIIQLARDPELRSRLAEGGRAVAGRRFDRRRLAGELTAMYRGFVSDTKFDASLVPSELL